MGNTISVCIQFKFSGEFEMNEFFKEEFMKNISLAIANQIESGESFTPSDDNINPNGEYVEQFKVHCGDKTLLTKVV